MKVAITTSGQTLDAPLDSRFGRAAGFVMYDTDQGVFEAVDNRQGVNSAQGAGIQAAEVIIRSGANCLITGHCGPKAFRALSAAGIRVFTTDAATVAEALEGFVAGSLSAMNSADVDGHWS